MTNGNGLVHKSQQNSNFTIVPNSILQSPELSNSAVGLFCKMMSLPHDWTYSIKGLAELSKEGPQSIASTIKELKQKGMLRIDKKLNKDSGHFEYFYHLFAMSSDEKPVENLWKTAPSTIPPVTRPGVTRAGEAGSGSTPVTIPPLTRAGETRPGETIPGEAGSGEIKTLNRGQMVIKNDQTPSDQAWSGGVYTKKYINNNNKGNLKQNESACGTHVDANRVDPSMEISPFASFSHLEEDHPCDSMGTKGEGSDSAKGKIEANPFGTPIRKDSRTNLLKRVLAMLGRAKCPLIHPYEVANLKKQIRAVVDVMGQEKYERFLDVLDEHFIGKPAEQFKPTISTSWDFTSSQKIKQVSDWMARNGLLSKGSLSSLISEKPTGGWLVNGKESMGGGIDYLIFPGIYKLYLDDDDKPKRLVKLENGVENEIWKMQG